MLETPGSQKYATFTLINERQEIHDQKIIDKLKNQKFYQKITLILYTVPRVMVGLIMFGDVCL